MTQSASKNKLKYRQTVTSDEVVPGLNVEKVGGLTLAQLDAKIIVRQIIQNHVVTAITYAYTAVRASATELAVLTTSITTTRLNSRINIQMLISGEIHHDSCFILQRVVGASVTEIGSPTGPFGTRYYGIVGSLYDVNEDSTMNQNKIQYIDSPTVAVGTVITYKLRLYGTASTAYINRTINAADSGVYERATSNVILTEMI